METNMADNLIKVPFLKNKQIRKAFVNKEWWFSVIDVISLLADIEDSQEYWSWVKNKEKSEAGVDLSVICKQLKLEASDGKRYVTDCAKIDGIFRIIQSIPSPKAEPFKQWLAKVGKERIEEIENPELGIERARLLYEKKGYPKEWIEKRVQGIAVRQKLTDEWSERGAKSDDYALLTNEIMNGAFGLKVNEYKKVKGLERENLRDHMTDLELIITMLGEATTTTLSKERDSQGIPELKSDAQDGGAVAGRTRKDVERLTGAKVVSNKNFLPSKKKLIIP